MVWLLVTLTEPDWTTVEAPFGPLSVQLTVLSCSPPGSVSCSPTLPVPISGVVPAFPVGSGEKPEDEQPTCPAAAPAAPTAPRSSALRTTVFRTIALIGVSGGGCASLGGGTWFGKSKRRPSWVHLGFVPQSWW